MATSSIDPEEPLVEDAEEVVAGNETDTSYTTDVINPTDTIGRLPDCLPIEETNFLRFYHLIHMIAPGAVRQRFDQEFPPDEFNAILLKDMNILKELKEKRVIIRHQWKLMFPGSGCSPRSTDFDISLMTCLFRHLLNISPKSGSFDTLPPPSDVTLGADLARIKYYRNRLAHYAEKDRKIDNDDFKIIWNDTCEALCRMGGTEYVEKCSTMLTMNLDSSNFDIYRRLWIEQSEMLKHVKDPVPHHEREKSNEEIRKWEMRKAVFVKTVAANELLTVLQRHKFVIVTGGPCTGKSFTVQHVLLNLRNTEYDIIPVNSSSDMIRYFSSKIHQIFYIDDFCGTFNISNNDIEEWERNKRQLADLFSCPKTMIVFTCRSQIYRDPKFKILNIQHLRVIDLSGDHQLSLFDKKISCSKIFRRRRT